MKTEQFIKTLRSLAECYQAFAAYSGAHVRALGLTAGQFDILATLGNTPGMTCREWRVMAKMMRHLRAGMIKEDSNA